MLAEQPCGSFLDFARITQRAKGIVEPKEKLQPLFVRQQLRFRLAMLDGRPDSISDVPDQRDLVRCPHAWLAAVNTE